MDAGPSQAWALRSVGAILAHVTYCMRVDASFSRLQKRPIVSGALGVRVGARVHVRVQACVRVFSFPPSPPEPLPCGGHLSRPLLRVVLVEDAFEAASLQAEWGPGCLSAPSKPGGGGLGSHRYAGAAPGASSRPAPPICASAAAVGAHGPAPSLGPCRACLVPFITTLTNPSRA